MSGMADSRFDRQGEQRLDRALLESLRPSLLRYFERRVANPDDAQDLTQEVFLHLTRSTSAAEALREPERYVFRIASNVLRDRLRRGKVRRAQHHIPLEDPDIAGELPSAERVYQGQQILERVLAAITELTPKCRTTFILHRFEGLSYTEIARRLGVSRSAIEKQMMHVIQILSERFPD